MSVYRLLANPSTGEAIQFIEGMAGEGRTTSSGAPMNPLQLGSTMWHFREEIRVTSPPLWIQNLVLPPLAALAKTLGILPYHERWNTEVADPEA